VSLTRILLTLTDLPRWLRLMTSVTNGNISFGRGSTLVGRVCGLWFGRRVAGSSRPKEGVMLADRLLKGVEKLAVVYCKNRRCGVDKKQRF